MRTGRSRGSRTKLSVRLIEWATSGGRTEDRSADADRGGPERPKPERDPRLKPRKRGGLEFFTANTEKGSPEPAAPWSGLLVMVWVCSLRTQQRADDFVNGKFAFLMRSGLFGLGCASLV